MAFRISQKKNRGNHRWPISAREESFGRRLPIIAAEIAIRVRWWLPVRRFLSVPMPARRHTKESIVQSLAGLAKSLRKDTLTKADVQKVVPVSSVNSHFGSLGAALDAAGLRRGSSTDHLSSFRRELSEDELFTSMYDVERQLGREPKSREYSANGKFSLKPLKRRYGKWSDVLAHYRRWKSQQQNLELPAASQDGSAPPPAQEIVTRNEHHDGIPPVVRTLRAVPVQLFGEPIDFRGLRHAPINEQGVVYVFGMVSRELGFYIEAVQQGFPVAVHSF